MHMRPVLGTLVCLLVILRHGSWTKTSRCRSQSKPLKAVNRIFPCRGTDEYKARSLIETESPLKDLFHCTARATSLLGRAACRTEEDWAPILSVTAVSNFVCLNRNAIGCTSTPLETATSILGASTAFRRLYRWGKGQHLSGLSFVVLADGFE